MFIFILLCYLLGIILAIPFLLITNTIAVKLNDSKTQLKYIFISWIFICMCIVYVIYMLCDRYKPISKIVNFFSQEPDLLRKKK